MLIKIDIQLQEKLDTMRGNQSQKHGLKHYVSTNAEERPDLGPEDCTIGGCRWVMHDILGILEGRPIKFP